MPFAHDVYEMGVHVAMEQTYGLLLCVIVLAEDTDKDVVLYSLVMILVDVLPRPGGGVILFFHFCHYQSSSLMFHLIFACINQYQHY